MADAVHGCCCGRRERRLHTRFSTMAGAPGGGGGGGGGSGGKVGLYTTTLAASCGATDLIHDLPISSNHETPTPPFN